MYICMYIHYSYVFHTILPDILMNPPTSHHRPPGVLIGVLGRLDRLRRLGSLIGGFRQVMTGYPPFFINYMESSKKI